MAINVKLTKDPEAESKTLTTYATYDFPGLTTTGTVFLYDADATGLTSWYLLDNSSGEYVAYSGDPNSEYINTLPVESPTANSISLFQSRVNGLINSAAISYGYDSIDNAVSYYNSLDPTKREEARSFSEWRDSVLFLAETNIHGFTSSGITLPDLNGFTSQENYSDFVVQGEQNFFGNENLGYQIVSDTNNTFIYWNNIEHTDNLYGVGSGQLLNSGNVSSLYSISATIDQTGLSSSWGDEDYSIKIRFTGTANDYGVQTDYEYKLESVNETFSGFSGLKVRINCFGKFS